MRKFGRLIALGLLVATALSTAVAMALGPTPVQDGAAILTLAQAKNPFESLKGRWVRPDGGYILAIKSVDPDGKMDVAYLNPNPIKVSKAEASLEGTTLKVFIELRDVGYPGSTYTLTYDPATDRLKGVYFQAVMQQKFEVVFARVE